jgi:hypothetical protein
MTTKFPDEMIRRMRGHLRMGYSHDSLVHYFGANAAYHMGLRVTRELLEAAGYKEAAQSGAWVRADSIRSDVQQQLNKWATDALIEAAGPVQVLTPEERQEAEEKRWALCEDEAGRRFEDAAYGRRD